MQEEVRVEEVMAAAREEGATAEGSAVAARAAVKVVAATVAGLEVVGRVVEREAAGGVEGTAVAVDFL